MERKTIIIEGNNFSDLESFYDEIDNVLTKDLGCKTGHNLDAFHDLLCGGFGVYESDELINIIWRNFSKSKNELGEKLVENLVSIITNYNNINFERQ